MTRSVAVERHELWAAVDRLTMSTTRAVLRDNGATIYGVVASLWDQSAEALVGGGESAVRTSNAAERSPVDLALVELRYAIRVTTRLALSDRRQRLNPRGVAAQIRQLAAVTVTHEPSSIGAWSLRFDTWARLLAKLLAAGDHVPASVRLRNSPCPACGAHSVIIASEDGPIVAPPIMIDFREGLVRAAQCSECGAMWWRGDELERLAVLLDCATPGVIGT
jgi:hypothetical protein